MTILMKLGICIKTYTPQISQGRPIIINNWVWKMIHWTNSRLSEIMMVMRRAHSMMTSSWECMPKRRQGGIFLEVKKIFRWNAGAKKRLSVGITSVSCTKIRGKMPHNRGFWGVAFFKGRRSSEICCHVVKHTGDRCLRLLDIFCRILRLGWGLAHGIRSSQDNLRSWKWEDSCDESKELSWAS